MPNRPEPIRPGPGQESVWDYPRPPAVAPFGKRIVVVFAGRAIADTRRAIKCMETSHPPSYYIPLEDVATEFLVPSDHRTTCEYKGTAHYYHLVVGERESRDAAWEYPTPKEPYGSLAGCVMFYPEKVDECTVDGERVLPQPGRFYGGWITHDIVGPFKGGPGTAAW